MKKDSLKYMAASLSLLAAVNAYSATPAAKSDSTVTDKNDSTARILDELVVEGRTQRVVSDGVEYRPGKKMKKAALNAISLLDRMQVPQLVVSPEDGSVTTIAGHGVRLFIDYRPASEEDVKGLRTEDVLRVEVLNTPSDPRFGGATDVVNFIMVKYEYGGYTTLSAQGRLICDRNVFGGVYDKFIYRDWSFTAVATGQGIWSDRSRGDETETFRDFTYGGSHIGELERTERRYDTYTKSNSQNAMLRAVWQKGKSYVLHDVRYGRSATPSDRENSSVRFGSPVLPDAASRTDAGSRSLSARVGGYYFFALPSDNTIEVDWAYRHSSNRQDRDYRLGSLDPISNDASEKINTPSIVMRWSKTFGAGNVLGVDVSSVNGFFETHYGGSYDGRQKLVSSETQLHATYQRRFGFGLSVYGRAGANYVLARVNGVNTIHNWYPRADLRLQYNPDSRHRVTFQGYWVSSAPQQDTYNSAMVRRNELLWVAGTPDLHPMTGLDASLTYDFIPCNKFSMSAFIVYRNISHAPCYRYGTVPGTDGIVRSYGDGLHRRELTARIAATARLLQNSLILSASGEMSHKVHTDLDRKETTYWSGRVSAAYYYGNFSFGLDYNTSEKSLLSMGERYRIPCTYGARASYSVGNLKAEVMFRNWFGQGYSRAYYTSPHYDMESVQWRQDLSRRLVITLSYTFTYGRKVRQGADFNIGSGQGSSIVQ